MRGLIAVMTGCQSQFAAEKMCVQIFLGFRTEVDTTERMQYSIQPLGAELSHNVQTETEQSLTLNFIPNVTLTLLCVCF